VKALRADGSRFPAELAISPSSTEDRVLFTAYLRDMNARRQAEAALRESEAHFRAIADNIPQMAWMARADGTRYWFNRRWYDYTGQSLEQAGGTGWCAIHHPEHLGRVLEGMRCAWEAGEPWEDTFLLRGKWGEYRWFLTRASLSATCRVRSRSGSAPTPTSPNASDRGSAARGEPHFRGAEPDGAALAAELDLGNIVQKVTDAATELSGAAFGAFFYNVVTESKELYTLYALSGASREAFAKYPLPSQHSRVRSYLSGRGHHTLCGHHPGLSLRQEHAASRHARRPSAGAQLSCGASCLALG
jgi:PAS domain S-box-containing protein